MQKMKIKKVLKNKVYAMTAGAPPPSAILEKMEKLGFEVMHVYGLTETYGHIFIVPGIHLGMNYLKIKKQKLKHSKACVILTQKK